MSSPKRLFCGLPLGPYDLSGGTCSSQTSPVCMFLGEFTGKAAAQMANKGRQGCKEPKPVHHYIPEACCQPGQGNSTSGMCVTLLIETIWITEFVAFKWSHDLVICFPCNLN